MQHVAASCCYMLQCVTTLPPHENAKHAPRVMPIFTKMPILFSTMLKTNATRGPWTELDSVRSLLFALLYLFFAQSLFCARVSLLFAHQRVCSLFLSLSSLSLFFAPLSLSFALLSLFCSLNLFFAQPVRLQGHCLYGVATISRFLEIVSFFCRIKSLL